MIIEKGNIFAGKFATIYQMDLTNRNIMDIEKLKYPIGKFVWPKEINEELLNSWISVIAEFLTNLKFETAYLTEEILIELLFFILFRFLNVGMKNSTISY